MAVPHVSHFADIAVSNWDKIRAELCSKDGSCPLCEKAAFSMKHFEMKHVRNAVYDKGIDDYYRFFTWKFFKNFPVC